MSWLVILAIGVATFGLRASFLLAAHRATPRRIQRTMRFVPAAVLPALAASVVIGDGGAGLDLRIAAAAVGAGVAWRTRNVAATMVAGLVVLWLLQAWSS